MAAALKLQSRRVSVDYSFDCLPFQPARAWPSATAATTVAVVTLTSAKQLSRAHKWFVTWDEHLLSPTVQLLLAAEPFDANEAATRAVIFAAYALQPAACEASPTLSADHSCARTKSGNGVIVLVRPIQRPAFVSSILAAGATFPPESCYNSSVCTLKWLVSGGRLVTFISGPSHFRAVLHTETGATRLGL